MTRVRGLHRFSFRLPRLQRGSPRPPVAAEREREVRDAPMADAARDGGRSDERPAESQFKVFVGGISWHLDDHKLRDGEEVPGFGGGDAAIAGGRLTPPALLPPPVFREFDPTEALVMMDKSTGRSRGWVTALRRAAACRARLSRLPLTPRASLCLPTPPPQLWVCHVQGQARHGGRH